MSKTAQKGSKEIKCPICEQKMTIPVTGKELYLTCTKCSSPLHIAPFKGDSGKAQQYADAPSFNKPPGNRRRHRDKGATQADTHHDTMKKV